MMPQSEIILHLYTAQGPRDDPCREGDGCACFVFCDEQVATTHTDCTVHLLTAPYLKCVILSVCVY